MGLPPLEYFDCFLDSPTFREIIQLYERELESNSTYVKQLVKECRHMISATEEFSKSQQSFAQVLGNFKFQTIGDQTEDEKMISSSLQTFAKLLFSIEDCRHNMLSTISVRLLQTLERFRKEQIQKAKDEKKKFDRASERYYQALEKHLSISSKKKEFTLNEADSSLQREHAGFRQSAFDYVCKLQDVHAQKQYELIEPIIGYISDVSTFLHQAYDNALSVKPELQAVQFKVQILRETHLNEQEKAYELKAQVIEEGEAGLVHHPEYLRQGILYVQDTKQPFGMGQAWHRYFCQFRKQEFGIKSKSRQLRIIPIGHNHGVAIMQSADFMEVKDCVRSRSEDVERRFCFEVEIISSKGETRAITMQALSSEERKGWLEIMEGKEPVYTSLRVIEVGELTPQGYVFIKKCIEAIESRGLDEEGLYRKPGVLSKATKLMKEAVEKGKVDALDLSDEFELDTKTVASAIKGYFIKQLGEPLLTFQLHEAFIEAAKISDHDKRVVEVRDLVGQLPEARRKILLLLIEHLGRVAAHSDQNLMKASNIGVVFGPTLMRPERESVAAIVDIKYQNIIVEMMIVERERIFDSKPGTSASPSVGENKKKPETGRLQKLETSRLREPPEPPVTAMNELALKRASIMADKKSASNPVFANSGAPIGPPPAHEPPPRPIPPLPGNPNIPPPPITRQKPSKSPEPYEQPLITRLPSDTALLSGSLGGGGGAGGGDRKRPTGPPPVPRNKPQMAEVGMKRRPQPEQSAASKPPHPAAGRTESAPAVPPHSPVYQNESAAFPFSRGASKFRERDKEREREQESEEKEREKERERDTSPPRPWRNQKPPGKKARALYDCDAEDSLELSFKKDEILYQVLESEEPSWLKAHRADGRTGLVPANYIEMLP